MILVGSAASQRLDLVQEPRLPPVAGARGVDDDGLVLIVFNTPRSMETEQLLLILKYFVSLWHKCKVIEQSAAAIASAI